MKRTCAGCGTAYTERAFRLDSGFCSECRPGLLSRPSWLTPAEARARSALQFALAVHVLYVLVFSLSARSWVLGYPAFLYSLLVSAYLARQFPTRGRRRYPTLTKAQVIGLLLLPLYGLAGFLTLFHWVQRLRHGR